MINSGECKAAEAGTLGGEPDPAPNEGSAEVSVNQELIVDQIILLPHICYNQITGTPRRASDFLCQTTTSSSDTI